MPIKFKRCYKSKIALILLTAFMSACANKVSGPNIEVYDLSQALKAREYVMKVDHFMVILDTSISMSESYQGITKLIRAKDLITRMNRTIPDPADHKLSSALRIFGNYDCAFCKSTKLIYGMSPYVQQDFETAVLKIQGANGESPLEYALQSARDDFKDSPGRIVIIIVSDFKEMTQEPVPAINNIYKEFGNRLSVFNVMIGNDPEGIKLMSQMEHAVKFAFSIYADQIITPQDMANFVKMVFLEKNMDSDGDGVKDEWDYCPNTPHGLLVDKDGCPLDTDKDGVYDSLDQCPDTPKNVPVDTVGCPLDSDKDGVFDSFDQCPNTPEKASVNETGCWIIPDLFFEEICPESSSQIERVFTILNDNPNICLNIEAITQSPESDQFNETLAGYHSRAIVYALVNKGIREDRLMASAKSSRLTTPSTSATPATSSTSVTPTTSSASSTPANKSISTTIYPKLIACPASGDQDLDGVSDYKDKCPNTPKGLKVDEYGCEKKISIELKIEFDSGKDFVKPEYRDQIEKVGSFMKDNPETCAIIEAHTDNSGKPQKNLTLSQKRAESVVRYLTDQFGIAESRLKAIGYGDRKPIADNLSKEGKQKNRRANAVIYYFRP